MKDLTAGFAHTIAGFAEGKDDLKMVGIDTIDALGLLAHSLLETQTGLKGIIDEGRAKKN